MRLAVPLLALLALSWATTADGLLYVSPPASYRGPGLHGRLRTSLRIAQEGSHRCWQDQGSHGCHAAAFLLLPRAAALGHEHANDDAEVAINWNHRAWPLGCSITPHGLPHVAPHAQGFLGEWHQGCDVPDFFEPLVLSIVATSPWWTTNNDSNVENPSLGEYGTPEDALLAIMHGLAHMAESHAFASAWNTIIVVFDLMSVAIGLLLVLLAVRPLSNAGARYNTLYFSKQAEATRACAQLTWYKRTPRRRTRFRVIANRTSSSSSPLLHTPVPTMAPHVLNPPPSPTRVSRLSRDDSCASLPAVDC